MYYLKQISCQWMDIFALFVFRKMYIVEPGAKVDWMEMSSLVWFYPVCMCLCLKGITKEYLISFSLLFLF